MVENVLAFRTKEKYIDPKYRKQIEDWDKKKKDFLVKRAGEQSRFRTMGLKVLEKQGEVNNYEDGIQYAQKLFFPLLVTCALSSDFADFFPVIGTIVKIIALAIIWYNIYIKGTAPGYLDSKYKIEISWKVRLFLRILGLTDLIPLINALPLTTLSVLIVWYQTRKQIQQKKAEQDDKEQEGSAIADYGKSFETA